MTDLTTTHLKCLLEQSTPGPWKVHTRDRRFDGETETWLYVGDTSALSVDYQLMSAAPQLAQEVIRLREELKEISEIWESASVNPDRTSAEQILAAQVVSHIDQLLGDHDE